MSGFQKQVNIQPAPGVEGAIASGNPPVTYVTGPGGLISGANGVTVGRFGFASYQSDGSERVDNSSFLVANGVDRTYAMGFIANMQQALNTVYLSEYGMTMLPWQSMEMFTRGDFWCKMLSTASRGQKAFVSLIDGSVQAAAPGATIAAFVGQASFATNVMTVTSVTSGTVKVGQQVFGAGLPANTYVASLGTGTGGAGTYNLTTSPGTISAQATTTAEYVETNFRILSAAASGEIAKIGYGA
jgi:hypothetical protein